MGKGSLVWFLIMLMGLLWGCAKEGERIVARVGNEAITLREFELKFAQDRPVNALKATSMEERKSFLQDMITERLMLQDAYRKGIDKEEVILEKVKEKEKWVAYIEYVYTQIWDKLIPESEVKEYYHHLNQEVKVRHIFLRMSTNPTPYEENMVRRRIRSILQRIRNGEDFAELARKYSEDARSADKGGDLGYIKWGKMGENFQRVAFSLKEGEVSEPVRSQIGYHIIKLEDRKLYLKRDYEEEKVGIQKKIISRKYRQEVQALVDQRFEELKREYKAKYEDDNIALFAKKMAESKEEEANKLSLRAKEDRFYLFTEEEKKIPLLTWEDGEINIGEFIGYLSNNPPPYNFPTQYYLKETKKRLKRMIHKRLFPDKEYKEEDLKELAIIFNNENIRFFAQKLAYSSKHNRFYLITAQDRNLPLITYQGGVITLNDFIATINQRYPPYNYPTQHYIEGTKKRLVNLLRRRLFTEKGRELRLHKTKRAQREINQYKEFLMLEEIKKREIIEGIDLTDEEVQRYFEQHSGRYDNLRKAKSALLKQTMVTRWEQWIGELRRATKVKIYENVLRRAFQRY